MRFRDREEAARLLAARLEQYRGRRPLVLGLPRGGVPMARIVADALEGDVDVVLVRKLRAPDQPELAIGALDEAGHVVRGEYFSMAPEGYVQDEVREQQAVLRARRRQYTRARPPISPTARPVILVDDGMATGATMLAAVHTIRQQRPAQVVVATGVASRQALDQVRAAADEVVCLFAPPHFYAVGEFYEDFAEVGDDQVVAALAPRRDPGRGA